MFISEYDFPLSYADNKKTGSSLQDEVTVSKIQTLGEYSAHQHLWDEHSHSINAETSSNHRTPKKRFLQEVIVTAVNSYGIPHSKTRGFLLSGRFYRLCTFIHFSFSSWNGLTTNQPPKFSLYSNSPPPKYCNSLTFSPTRAVWNRRCFNHCRNTPILRLPCTTFFQRFHLSN